MNDKPLLRRIFAIGEIVFDIILKESRVVSSNPGGAMLNTAVSLGRMELPVSLISELGTDQVGKNIIRFLEKNSVNTEYIFRFNKGNTALALAFLDNENNANYEFYKSYPANRFFGEFPQVEENDIILFGSFFALSSEVRKPLMTFLHHAADNGAMIIYDPNFRKSNGLSNPMIDRYIAENIALADIVRASDEDLLNLHSSLNSPQKAFQFISQRECNILIYTQSKHKANFVTNDFSCDIPIPNIKTISTIGAGDNFNAGLIYGLYHRKISKSILLQTKHETWREIVKTAVRFGSHVCSRLENYIDVDFAKTHIK